MHPLSARIRLDSLRHNYQTLEQIHGGKMLAVIKADAYGHGVTRCAHALSNLADGSAVAATDKVVELHESGITSPIVLLEGVSEALECATVDKYNLWPSVGSQWQLEALIVRNWQTPVRVWLRMDSGMHRAGFFPHNCTSAYTALKQCKHIDSIVKFSHFACAGGPDNSITEMQLEAFDLACEGLGGEESLTNSTAILNIPKARRDWGRAGLALYGISPFGGVNERLKPVICLTSRVFDERVLRPHSPVGYGTTFYTNRSTHVGPIACGYVDGYPRRASTNSPAAVKGKRSRIISRVSVDMITVELDASQGGLSTGVELQGDVVGINEVTGAAGMTPYGILCNVKRTEFTYSE